MLNNHYTDEEETSGKKNEVIQKNDENTMN